MVGFSDDTFLASKGHAHRFVYIPNKPPMISCLHLYEVILTKFLKAALSPSSGSELSDDEAICEPAAPCQSGGLLHAARLANSNKSDEVFEANIIVPRTRMSQLALARSQCEYIRLPNLHSKLGFFWF